jgi:hypothetical protein
VIIIGKLSKVAAWMLSMPFCVEVVHVPSTSTAAKNTEKGMVGHMPDSGAQCCTFETTFCIGGRGDQYAPASRNTGEQKTFHEFPLPLCQR